MKAVSKPSPKSVLITGASSGIGAALAMEYAAADVTLFLSGRNRERLQQSAEACEALGAQVRVIALDVRDAAGMRQWLSTCDRERPLELVIANAGVSGGPKDTLGEREEDVRTIFDTNLYGVLNTVHPAIDCMRPRQKGQIAVVSSMAGYRGLPSAAAYSASKAAVKAYGEGLHGQLKASGLSVNVICPGFVESRITAQNDFPMPFFMKAPRAARIIRKGLEEDNAVIAFPWQMRLMLGLLRALPSRLALPFLGRLPAKRSKQASG